MKNKTNIQYTERDKIVREYGIKQGIHSALDVGVGIGEVVGIPALTGMVFGSGDSRYGIAAAGLATLGALYYGASTLVGKSRKRKEAKALNDFVELEVTNPKMVGN